MEEFNIGQIFEGEYPTEAADWCNNRGDCFIEEIEPVNYVRRFEIKNVPPLSEEELKQLEILEIKAELDELDLKSIRAIRAGETDYIESYEAQAQSLRAQLEVLEG